MLRIQFYILHDLPIPEIYGLVSLELCYCYFTASSTLKVISGWPAESRDKELNTVSKLEEGDIEISTISIIDIRPPQPGLLRELEGS